jgi:hypothetical protein
LGDVDTDAIAWDGCDLVQTFAGVMGCWHVVCIIL